VRAPKAVFVLSAGVVASLLTIADAQAQVRATLSVLTHFSLAPRRRFVVESLDRA
jgi:hypothetical protein